MLQINGETEIYGIIGYPIKHTFSPFIHNTLFEKFNLNSVYIPIFINPAEFEPAIKGIKAINIKGLNVTLPYKIEILKFLDDLDSSAMLTGAVNTVKFQETKAYGFNTDAFGFIKSLKFTLNNKNVLLLGAGGAARAVLYGLLKERAKKIYISNIIEEDAKKMVEGFKKIIKDAEIEIVPLSKELLEKLKDVFLVVNATSCGMKETDDIIIFPTNPEIIYYDLIYNPIETKFLKQARRIGAKTISGLSMLIYQALYSFEIWTGIKIEETEKYYDEIEWILKR